MNARTARLLLAAAALVCASVAQAQYTGLYVFGDSLSDTGNNTLLIGSDPGQVVTGNTYVPTFTYASGQYSNGNVWVHTFASGLGLSATPSLAGGGIYAFGGAQTSVNTVPSLLAQTSMFLGASGGVAPSSALYVLAGGGNNARAALQAIGGGADIALTIGTAAAQYAADVGLMVDRLQAAGAKDIIVWNTPNLGVAPAVTALGAQTSFLATALAGTMNGALAARLAGESDVEMFDVFGLVSSIAANPAAYGLGNATDACGAVAGCNASSYLFWDGIHPTAAGHQILGDAMTVAAIPEPETYAMLIAGLGLLLLARRRKERAA